MAQDNKDPKGRKIFSVSFNFSWLYFLILLGIGYLMFNNRQSSAPEKVEWTDVQQMIGQGDVAELTFVRNDFKGEVTVLYELELDDGEYTLTIDYDSYVDSYTDSVMDNLVPVLKEEILDQIEMYGYTEDEFLSQMGYSSMDEYCEESVLASIDTFAGDLENETVEGDYKVTSGFGAAKTSVKLDNDTILYFEKGNLVGYIDEDLVDDIRDAEDLDDLKDAFEDADADSSLIDVLDMCDTYGISAEDFVDWLDDCGLLDDGLVYEAQ